MAVKEVGERCIAVAFVEDVPWVLQRRQRRRWQLLSLELHGGCMELHGSCLEVHGSCLEAACSWL